MTPAPVAPSGMVRDLMFPARCIECREPATKKASKGGERGTQLCARCHRLDFNDPSDGGEA